MTPLTPEGRAKALAELPDWSFDPARNAIHRRVKLADFSATFALMTRIAMAAEAADHHPEWTNVYNRLDIWLTTHDAGGVSTRDIALARQIDALIGESANNPGRN